MSAEDISRLEREEQELMETLARKRLEREALVRAEKEKIEAEAERIENLKPLEIRINRIQYEQVIIHSRYREDLIQIYKSTPGHAWNGYLMDLSTRNKTKIGINAIPLTSYLGWKEKVEGLENKSILFSFPQVEAELKYQTQTPTWSIDLADNLKYFTFEMGPRQRSSLLNDISGLKWNESGYGTWRTGTVPISEGWRIPQLLEAIPGVIYSDSARILIFAQVEKRVKLDKLAKQEDSDDPRLEVLTRQVFARKPGEKVESWDTFRNHLWPFQRVGVNFALESNGRMLLSDGTGLGKTWQILAYCEIMRSANKDFMSLITVKASNIPNWKREILRLTGIEPVICTNSPTYQTKVMGEIMLNRPSYVLIGHETLGTYVTKNTPENMAKEEEDRDVVYMWSVFFADVVKPDFVGIDEAHQIKNPSTHRSKACRLLASIPHVMPATASPIHNRTKEFWAPLYMVDPFMFQSEQKFENDYTVNGRYPKNVEKLRDLLRPMFLRRTKKEVQKQLPPINRITKIVELDEKHQTRYNQVLAGLWEELESFDPHGKGRGFKDVTGILATFTRLRQICSHFKAQEFTPDLAQGLIDESELEAPKVLIFTQFKAIAYEIAKRLGGEAICTVYKKEDIKVSEDGVSVEESFESLDNIERDKLFEVARNDKYIKFIVTTSAAKEGHNMEFCDWVIFNDQYWGPEDHIQCEGRAYGRLADPHPIDSFYVIADVDIEVIMQDLLTAKMNIIEEAVEGIEGSREDSSVTMNLIQKIKESMWRKSA